jgi:hypothetical protein
VQFRHFFDPPQADTDCLVVRWELRAENMRKLLTQAIAAAALAAIPVAAQAAINGFHADPRVFNDFSTSTLTINNPGTNPEAASIDDRNWANDGVGGNGANRHDLRASTDNGASDGVFGSYQGYTISTTFTLTDGSNSPRKEVGIRFNSQNGGDGLFIVNSDAGEIVAFGAGAPFHSFGSNGSGNGYVPGTQITLTETYIPPGIVDPRAQMTYSVNYPTRGLVASYTDYFSNLEGAIAGNYTFGVYAQGGPNTNPTNDLNDFIHVDFANLQATQIPEPASMALTMLGGVAFLARRRVV